MTLAKLQNGMKKPFDQVFDDLKEVYNGQGKYSKQLDKVWRLSPAMSFGRLLICYFAEVQGQTVAYF